MAQNDWWLQPLAEYKPEEDIVTPLSSTFETVLQAALQNLNYYIEKPSKNYPSMEAGVEVTAGALDEGAWQLGDFVDVIPAEAIGKPFKIIGLSLEDISSVGVYELVLYAGDHGEGDEEEIGRVRFARHSSFSADRMLVNVPGLEADTQVSGRLASDAGDESVTIALDYIELD